MNVTNPWIGLPVRKRLWAVGSCGCAAFVITERRACPLIVALLEAELSGVSHTQSLALRVRRLRVTRRATLGRRFQVHPPEAGLAHLSWSWRRLSAAMAEKQAGLVGEPDPEGSSPGTSESWNYDSNCVFCRVAAGQEPKTELFHCEVGGDRPGGWGPGIQSLLAGFCLCRRTKQWLTSVRDPEVSSVAFAVQ